MFVCDWLGKVQKLAPSITL